MKSGIVPENSVSAVITGGSSGIGLEFARQLAGRGYALMLVSNQAEQLEDAVKELHTSYPDTEIHTLCKDLSERGAAEAVLTACKADLPPVEVFVNNAGIFTFKPMTDLSQKHLDLYFDLHMRAVTELSLTFARHMQQRGKGYILNMSSMSCWMPMPGIALYSATKAYIRAFTRALHYELLDSGVTATAACPGGIATDLFGLPENLKRLAVSIGALDTPDRFARKAVKQMLRGRKQYINGLLNRLSIFFVAITPTWLRLQIKRRMLDRGIKV